jgi:hypothetical protein
MMLTYAIAIVVVLVLCVLGMSIGLLLGGKGLRTCGRASLGEQHGDVSCPSCSGKEGECKKEKTGVSVPGVGP